MFITLLCAISQEFISNGRISKQSLLALSQMSGNGNISPSANDQERKLVSALSHHIVYRKEERVGGRGEEGRRG